MGRLNDKMTQLADKIRVKNIGYPYRMSIDKMIELIDNLEYAVWLGDALPGDVSAGVTFSSYTSGKLQTGTMPDTTVSIAGNVVTVPAGRIRKEQTLTVQSGSVSIDRNKVTVKEGYVQNDSLTVQSGSVTLSSDKSKVIVEEGYVMDEEIPLPGGFQLVKVTHYTPYRAKVTAPGTVLVKGPGNYESDWGGYDFSDIDGTYAVTDDTKYQTGFNRVYKQQNGKYYLCGYNSESDWDSPQWYISETRGNYGYNSKAYYYGSELPTGNQIWYSDYMGEIPVTTTVTNATYPEQPLILSGVKADDYDVERRKFSFGSSATTLTGFEKKPTVSGVFAMKGQRLFGNMISYVDDFVGGSTLFAIAAEKGVNDLISGGSPTIYGDGQAVLRNGEFCFDNVRALDYTIGSSMSALEDFTFEMDYTLTSDNTGYCGFFGNKDSWSDMNFHVQWGRSGYRPSMFWCGYYESATGGTEHREWVNDGKYHHVAVVRFGNSVTLYSDGVVIAQYRDLSTPLNFAIQNALSVGVQHVENAIFPGRMKHFRICNFAAYTEEFSDALPYWVGDVI